MNVVALVTREISTIPAMPCLDQQNIRICEQCIPSLRQHANKRIILRTNDQSGDGNLVNHARARGPVVVIVGIAEPAVAGHNPVIKLPQRTDGADTIRSVEMWEERNLATEAPHQPAQKMPLI